MNRTDAYRARVRARIASASDPSPLPLTDRQAEVYRWIYEQTRDRGIQPTYREIGIRFGIRSPNGVWCHLHPIALKGYVDFLPGRHGFLFLRRPDGRPFLGFRDIDEDPNAD
jgi:DNA-binding CsgD family transcriptional regulator